VNPSPYWQERMAEEHLHLQSLHARRPAEFTARLARIDTELQQLSKGVGKMRLGSQPRTAVS
jgi:hypothetical protein